MDFKTFKFKIRVNFSFDLMILKDFKTFQIQSSDKFNIQINYLKMILKLFRFKVRIGDRNHDSDLDDGNVRVVEVVQSFVHPKYDSVKAYFDIAVLETEEVEFTRVIGPICLPRY